MGLGDVQLPLFFYGLALVASGPPIDGWLYRHLSGGVSRLQGGRLLGQRFPTTVYRPLCGSRDSRQTVSGQVARWIGTGWSWMYADWAEGARTPTVWSV